MYYTQEQIDRANQADLVLFLQSQGEPLERAGQEYRWKRHDSLTVRGNKWYRHSQSKGGGPIDFVMEFFGKSFTEAVELLTGEKGAAPPPDRPSSAPLSDFRLPPRSPDCRATLSGSQKHHFIIANFSRKKAQSHLNDTVMPLFLHSFSSVPGY